MSNDAAGFTRVTARSVASPNGAFDAGLRPDPFPDQAASLLPGLLTATRTGLTPAGDNELMSDQVNSNDHLQLPGALPDGRAGRALCRRRRTAPQLIAKQDPNPTNARRRRRC